MPDQTSEPTRQLTVVPAAKNRVDAWRMIQRITI
jgi:hypothetical protein